jgi:deoxyribonuclease V
MNIVQMIYDLTAQIPSGRISTYGALALALGDLRASRAVGRILNLNPTPIIVPCHRVVYSDGKIGGYKEGVEKKIALLRKEGVKIKDEKIVDLEKLLFKEFKTDLPLKKLRREQKMLADQVILEDSFEKVESVGGVDVAYSNNMAFGAYVLYDYNGEILEEHVIKTKVEFPYIPTYLTYREYPIIEKLIRKGKSSPTVLMVDGNGILHPFGIGIATHVGLKLKLSTIGVAKNLLCGELKKMPDIGMFSPVFYKEQIIGYGYRGTKYKPIYISPGHKISFETSAKIIKHYCKARIPEPLKSAHHLATTIRKENS